MAKDSRFKQTYRQNASRLHKNMGDLLRANSYFQNYRIYQEYPVNKVSPYFDSGREHFDWVVLDIKLVIECHGQQHYQPVQFGNISKEEALRNLELQQIRDEAKRAAAEKAGWTYIVFKYDEPITIANLLAKMDSSPKYQEIIPPKEDSQEAEKKEEAHKEQLQRASNYRKKAYQRFKEWLKKRKTDEDSRSQR